MKRRYRARLDAILAILGTRYGDRVRTGGGETGFHLHVRFGGRRFGPRFADACSAEGLRISTEDEFRAEPSSDGDALVIGYGNVADEELDEGLELLGALVERNAGRESRSP
ncbi:hypothetical protein [Sorangium sp. So ce1335]|uniref:hypothetical protein n=1 Tax=Sorangium sp. So ce1335 TaxID=3133335 RepID=UPI003F5D817D